MSIEDAILYLCTNYYMFVSYCVNHAGMEYPESEDLVSDALYRFIKYPWKCFDDSGNVRAVFFMMIKQFLWDRRRHLNFVSRVGEPVRWDAYTEEGSHSTDEMSWIFDEVIGRNMLDEGQRPVENRVILDEFISLLSVGERQHYENGRCLSNISRSLFFYEHGRYEKKWEIERRKSIKERR